MPLHLDIVTQERLVYSGEADFVSLPGANGRMGILPNHMAMLTTLDFGEVMVRRAGEEEFYAVGGGFAEVQPDHVIVLADSAEQAEEIDIDRAQHARDRALQAMEEGVPEDPVRYAQIQAALMRARIRIDVSMRRQRRGPTASRYPSRREEEEG